MFSIFLLFFYYLSPSLLLWCFFIDYSEGWEKLGLFEYYQRKNDAKKKIQEEKEKQEKEEKKFKETKDARRYVLKHVDIVQ